MPKSFDSYLQDRYAFHAAAVDKVRAAALWQADRETQATLAAMVGPLARERRLFERLLEERGAPPARWKDGLARLQLRVSVLLERLPLVADRRTADVRELEELEVALHRTAESWRLLRSLEVYDGLFDEDQVDTLIAAAEDRLSELRRLRLATANAAFQ
jgi:hypothetical protein